MVHAQALSNRAADEDFLTTGEVARIFQKSEATIRPWRHRGVIKPYKVTSSGVALYLRREVLRAKADRDAVDGHE